MIVTEAPLLCPRPKELQRTVPLLLQPPGQPLDMVGQELKVAFALIGHSALVSGDNSFWLRKCRELCLRPAVEPLLLAHWHKLTSFTMTEPQLAALCSMLSGAKRQARTKSSYGLWDGGDVRFEPPDQAGAWWADIQHVATKPELSPLLPAYCFARTIIAHPYPDGNGRLARALVHAALARMHDLAAPILPLAPAFYMNASKVGLALRQLSDTSNWEPFQAVFWQVIADAQNLAKVDPLSVRTLQATADGQE